VGGTWIRWENYIKVYSENLKERDDLGDLGVNGRIILELTLEK